MCKRVLLLTGICLVFLGVNTTFAQFPGMDNLKKLTNQSGGGVSISNLSSSKTNAITAYLASTQELSQSLEKAAEAFGIKKEVLEKLAVVNSLKEGNVNDKSMEKARKASEEANEMIKQKMQETKAPSIEGKKLIAESMVHLTKGIQQEIALVGQVQNLSNQAQSAVSSASPMEILKVKDIASTAFMLIKNIPPDLKLTKNILSSYVQYAKANNIKVPKDATGLLKDE